MYATQRVVSGIFRNSVQSRNSHFKWGRLTAYFLPEAQGRLLNEWSFIAFIIGSSVQVATERKIWENSSSLDFLTTNQLKIAAVVELSIANLELASGQKNPAGQSPEQRQLVSSREDPNLPAGQGYLTPFVQ